MQAFESVPPKDASGMVQSGDWVLVDVRPASRYEEAHPAGAVNIQLYKEVRLRLIMLYRLLNCSNIS